MSNERIRQVEESHLKAARIHFTIEGLKPFLHETFPWIIDPEHPKYDRFWESLAQGSAAFPPQLTVEEVNLILRYL